MLKNLSRVSVDFKTPAKIRMNCTSGKKQAKKTLTLEATDDAWDFTNKFFMMYVYDRRKFPDYERGTSAQFSHMHQVMRPIIHVADDSLRQLDPKL